MDTKPGLEDTRARLAGLAVVENALLEPHSQPATPESSAPEQPVRAFEINGAWHAFDPIEGKIVRLYAHEHQRKAGVAFDQAEHFRGLARAARDDSVRKSYLRVAASYQQIGYHQDQLASLACQPPPRG